MPIGEIQHPRATGSLVRLAERAASLTVGRGDAAAGQEEGFIGPLLGEAGARKFRSEVWQRHTRVLSTRSASLLTDCWPTTTDIDELFSSIDFPATNFDLADGTQPLPKSSYAPSGAVDRGRVLNFHRGGATIILRAAHRWSAKLRRACARLEWDFGFPVQANIYLTPPGRKSTPPHWDTHDLFIVQVAGAKSWRIFESDYHLPMDSQRFSDELFHVGPLREEVRVSAGDVLYLPRGQIHEPVADSYSIHLSLGVHVSRWADLLFNLVEAAAEDLLELRSSIQLPAGRVDNAVEARLTEQLLGMIDLLRDRVSCGKAVRRHLEAGLLRHMDHRPRQLLSIMQQTRTSGPSNMRRVPSAYLWLESKAERIEVHWKGGSFSVPAKHKPFIDTLLAGKRFTLDNAPSSEGANERSALCDALIENGLIEVIEP